MELVWQKTVKPIVTLHLPRAHSESVKERGPGDTDCQARNRSLNCTITHTTQHSLTLDFRILAASTMRVNYSKVSPPNPLPDAAVLQSTGNLLLREARNLVET